MMQLGFRLMLVTIRALPPLVDGLGRAGTFAMLALGPAAGIWAMARLGHHSDAARPSGGRR